MPNDNIYVIIRQGERSIWMYEVEFYRDNHGKSDIVDYLDELQEKAQTSKTDRVNREKILSYIGALAEYGTRIGQPKVKHIEGKIWELRPLNNRIFFFYWRENRFVLLHYFIKKNAEDTGERDNEGEKESKGFFGKEQER